MMINSLKKITIIVSAILISYNVMAQRTMPGEKMVGISAGYNFEGTGVSATFGGYTKSGYWQTGLSGDMYNKPLSAGNDRLEYCHIAASGYYMAALARTRSRSFNLYGGGGIFMGYEAVDPFRRLPKSIETNLKNGYFLYGLFAGLESEIFLTRRVALTVTGHFPLNFSSKLDRLHCQAKVGVRIML